MPIYDFQCAQGHREEHQLPSPPPERVTCSECGRSALRVFSKPMVPLMGYDATHRRSRRKNLMQSDHRDESLALRRL